MLPPALMRTRRSSAQTCSQLVPIGSVETNSHQLFTHLNCSWNPASSWSIWVTNMSASEGFLAAIISRTGPVRGPRGQHSTAQTHDSHGERQHPNTWNLVALTRPDSEHNTMLRHVGRRKRLTTLDEPPAGCNYQLTVFRRECCQLRSHETGVTQPVVSTSALWSNIRKINKNNFQPQRCLIIDLASRWISSIATPRNFGGDCPSLEILDVNGIQTDVCVTDGFGCSQLKERWFNLLHTRDSVSNTDSGALQNVSGQCKTAT